MTTENNTLADVQPGGMVRLLDQAERTRFEAWAGENYHLQRMGDVYRSAITTDAWRAWQAALSAQPSPGGQGDARETFSKWWAQQSDDIANLYAYEIARLGWDGALAARQPVGEPVAKSVGIDALVQLLVDDAEECAKGWIERGDAYASGKSAGLPAAADYFRKIATSQRWSEFLSSPAQALDLGRWSQRHAEDLKQAIHTALSAHAGSLSQKKRDAISAYVKRLLIDSQAVGNG